MYISYSIVCSHVCQLLNSMLSRVYQLLDYYSIVCSLMDVSESILHLLAQLFARSSDSDLLKHFV